MFHFRRIGRIPISLSFRVSTVGNPITRVAKANPRIRKAFSKIFFSQLIYTFTHSPDRVFLPNYMEITYTFLIHVLPSSFCILFRSGFRQFFFFFSFHIFLLRNLHKSRIKVHEIRRKLNLRGTLMA